MELVGVRRDEEAMKSFAGGSQAASDFVDAYRQRIATTP
jgi:hypothetical protein